MVGEYEVNWFHNKPKKRWELTLSCPITKKSASSWVMDNTPSLTASFQQLKKKLIEEIKAS